MSFFGDPGARATTGRSASSALLASTTSRFSELEVRRQQPDGALPGHAVAALPRRGVDRARPQHQIEEMPVGRRPGRCTDRRVTPNIVSRRHRVLRGRERQQELAVPGQGHNVVRRAPDPVRRPVRQARTTTRSTSAPGRPSRRRLATRRRPARRSRSSRDPVYGQIYRVVRANLNAAQGHEAELLRASSCRTPGRWVTG